MFPSTNDTAILEKLLLMPGAVSYRHAHLLPQEQFDSMFDGFANFSNLNNSTVAYMEEQLKFSFPDQYRQFILEFGFYLLKGKAIYGIPPNSHAPADSNCYSVADVTFYHIKNNYDDIKSCMQNRIIVSDDSMGGFYVLNRNGHVQYMAFHNAWLVIEEWSCFFNFIRDYLIG